MLKKLQVIILGLSMISCVTTPESRFPDFADQAKNISAVDVLVDIVVSEEFEGHSFGIDLERNRLVAKQAWEEIDWILKDKGYVVNSLHVNGGLFIKWDELAEAAKKATEASRKAESKKVTPGKNTDDSEFREGSSVAEDYTDGPPLVFIENEQFTGKAVEEPFLDPGSQPWTNSDVRAFLNGLQEQSVKYFAHVAAEGKPEPELSLEQIPDDLKLTSDTLLIIRIHASEVSAETSLALGLASGFLSLLVSGGNYLASETYGDGHVTEAMLVDTSAKKILWYNRVQHLGSEQNSYAVAKLLKPLAATGLSPNPVVAQSSEGTSEAGMVTIPVYDLSGEYRSEITARGTGYTGFFPRPQRITTMTITQTDDAIKAKFEPNGFIEGTIVGDKVNFDWRTTSAGSGEWRINPAANRLSGTWNSQAWSSSGEWSLSKIGEPIKITQFSRPVNATPTSTVANISGTWVSSISSSHIWRFSTEEERTMRLEIKQEGEQIIAENKDFDLKIIGQRNGNNIRFYALPNKMTQWEITGEWKLIPDTNKIRGSWELKHSQHPARGDWNLQKIQ